MAEILWQMRRQIIIARNRWSEAGIKREICLLDRPTTDVNFKSKVIDARSFTAEVTNLNGQRLEMWSPTLYVYEALCTGVSVTGGQVR